jgi:hypothetical protein
VFWDFAADQNALNNLILLYGAERVIIVTALVRRDSICGVVNGHHPINITLSTS